MNKTFLIYVLFCIFLIGSVSALEFNLKEQVSDVSSLEASFGTRNTELVKEQVFTELKVNDALKKEAVFSMDTSKFDFDFNRDIDVVFNEVCGKVTGFRISELKDGDYLVKADIENALCSDGTYGYKVDWMPKLKIGSNELINQKWAWWNQTFRLDNPNVYYLIIEATSVSVASLEINDVHIFNLSSTEWLMYENISNNYQVSKAKVMKTLFYGTDGTNPRVNSTYITGLVALKTGDASDVGKQGFYAYQYAFSSSHKADGVFLDTTTNTNFNSWWYLYAENSGVGVTKDMTTNDTSAYSYSNPLSVNASVEKTTSEYGRWYINNTLIDTASTTPTNNNAQGISRGFMITKGNMTWSSTGGTFTYRDFYKNDSIPAFSYWNFSDYFSVRFIKWNGSYAPVNITMSNGTNTLNFTSSTGYITTNIANADLSLWNISLTGDNYYSRTYTSYNVSTDIFLNTTILYTLTASSGVFGELSSIVLNLSKGVNQSYTNADLVYNGVVYASPTQTEYTNYTLFTQSITNSAIGNFSYYFNVSLTDYGNVFNFSTVNGSHLVTGLSLNLSYFDTSLASMNGKNVSLTLIGLVNSNYSTSTGLLDISNLSTGDYTLLSSSTGYVQNSYLLTLNSSGFSPLSLYLQPINVTYYGLVTVKDKYSKDTISGATLTIQRYINNAWVTEQIYTTDFNGQAQGYFVIDTQFYNFLVSIGSNTYFGVINSNANKKVIYAQDITNGMIIEIDTQQGNSYYEFISSEYVSTSLNFTNTSNTTGYFTFRWIDLNGNSRNGTLNVYVNNVLNCTNSAVSSSGIIICSVSAGSPTYFLGGGYIDGVGINSYLAKLGVFNEFSLDWGAFGWIMSIFLVIIGYFAFSSIPSMSLLVGTGIFALMSILNLVFKGINPLMFIGFMAVAFLLAKIPSRQGGNG